MPRGTIQLLTAILLLAFVAPDGEAQRRRPSAQPQENGGRGFFMIGAQQLDMDDLNGRLVAAGYPELDDVHLTLGGGGFWLRDGFIIGGHGHGVMGRSETTTGGEFRVGAGGGYGMLDLGYAVVQQDGLLIYPLLGLGGGGMMVSITERSSPSFDDLLEQPRRSVQLGQGQLLLSPGLGIDYVFAGRRLDRGIAVGLRVGWMFAPVESGWSFGRNDVAGGPDSGLLQGGFIRVTIGGGRR